MREWLRTGVHGGDDEHTVGRLLALCVVVLSLRYRREPLGPVGDAPAGDVGEARRRAEVLRAGARVDLEPARHGGGAGRELLLSGGLAGRYREHGSWDGPASVLRGRQGLPDRAV